MLDVWPDLQAKGVRWIKTSELFFLIVFNSLLTQYTRSVRRHLGNKKSKKQNLKNWFPYSIIFKTLNYDKVSYVCFMLSSPEWRVCHCLVLKQNYLWFIPKAWGFKSYRCLLIRHKPDPITTVARAAQYKPLKGKSSQCWLLNINQIKEVTFLGRGGGLKIPFWSTNLALVLMQLSSFLPSARWEGSSCRTWAGKGV